MTDRSVRSTDVVGVDVAHVVRPKRSAGHHHGNVGIYKATDHPLLAVVSGLHNHAVEKPLAGQSGKDALLILFASNKKKRQAQTVLVACLSNALGQVGEIRIGEYEADAVR